MSEHEDDKRHFIRVKSSTDRRIIPKERGFGKYSPEARKKKKRVVENRNLNEKLRAVTSSVKRKTLRDIQSYYMVIELIEETSDSKINDIYKGLTCMIKGYNINDAPSTGPSGVHFSINMFETQGSG